MLLYTIFHTGGDWLFFFARYFHLLSFYPYLWSQTNGNGLGQNISFVLGFKTIFAIEGKFLIDILHSPWAITEQLMFFLPYWVIGILGSYFLGSGFFKNIWQHILVVILYMFNTYALMLVGGGQMGVAIAYALLPGFLVAFFYTFNQEKAKLQLILLTSFLLGLLILWDVRIALLALLITGGYLFFLSFLSFSLDKLKWVQFFCSIIVALLLNAFWILPLVVVKDVQVSQAYTSSGIVSFLSFANFENALGLMHPNWPENIFGKVGFMRPEFLILPIIAFASLLGINIKSKTENKKHKDETLFVLFFSLLGLLGIFLAKGTNNPFGQLYYWMSGHIPGFILFRDPTKFYILIVVSYSILIPFSWNAFLNKVLNFKYLVLNKTSKHIIKWGTILLLFVYLLLLIRPLWLGQLTGTFQAHAIPSDYQKLAYFLDSQPTFFRTFWVPTTERFGYFSNTHPEVAGYDFFGVTSISGLLMNLEKPHIGNLFADSSIRYIIVPDDSFGEIFLNNRQYSESAYRKTVEEVKQLPYVAEVAGFGNIKVFQVADAKNHFWSPDGSVSISYTYKNPISYSIYLHPAKKGDTVVFSESYDSGWKAIFDSKTVTSLPYKTLFNSFILPKDGTYSLQVVYGPQKWVDIGLWVSGITIVGILLLLVIKLVTFVKL